MITTLRPALVMLALFTALTGGLYPLAVTGVAQGLFPREANGNLVRARGLVVGSSLIGQPFESPRYFWGRPSATPGRPYDANASGGSNLGPSNPALRKAVAERLEALRAADPGATGAVPVDLVTASGSGLDPHISPAAALFQVDRVAKARGLAADQVRALAVSHVEHRLFGMLGEPRVNVLLLNLALDDASGRAAPNAM